MGLDEINETRELSDAEVGKLAERVKAGAVNIDARGLTSLRYRPGSIIGAVSALMENTPIGVPVKVGGLIDENGLPVRNMRTRIRAALGTIKDDNQSSGRSFEYSTRYKLGVFVIERLE